MQATGSFLRSCLSAHSVQEGLTAFTPCAGLADGKLEAMATDRRYEVKMSVPDGAMPGTLLDVPVRGGSEKASNSGWAQVLSQAEGSAEWDLKVEEAIAPTQDASATSEVMRSAPVIQPAQEESPKPTLSEQPVAYTVRDQSTDDGEANQGQAKRAALEKLAQLEARIAELLPEVERERQARISKNSLLEKRLQEVESQLLSLC
ncbi:unnamed protein product [Symbiodinium sp. CCMP2456]|nr:unnamed protein product [Symbiodinium sp. CCMP2456]